MEVAAEADADVDVEDEDEEVGPRVLVTLDDETGETAWFRFGVVAASCSSLGLAFSTCDGDVDDDDDEEEETA